MRTLTMLAVVLGAVGCARHEVNWAAVPAYGEVMSAPTKEFGGDYSLPGVRFGDSRYSMASDGFVEGQFLDSVTQAERDCEGFSERVALVDCSEAPCIVLVWADPANFDRFAGTSKAWQDYSCGQVPEQVVKVSDWSLGAWDSVSMSVYAPVAQELVTDEATQAKIGARLSALNDELGIYQLSAELADKLLRARKAERR